MLLMILSCEHCSLWRHGHNWKLWEYSNTTYLNTLQGLCLWTQGIRIVKVWANPLHLNIIQGFPWLCITRNIDWWHEFYSFLEKVLSSMIISTIKDYTFRTNSCSWSLVALWFIWKSPNSSLWVSHLGKASLHILSIGQLPKTFWLFSIPDFGIENV